MTAKNPVRRNVPARVLAEQFGSSERTVRRIVAEPRADFLRRAEARRARVWEMRQQGMSYQEIATELDCPVGTVGTMLRKARQERETDAEAAS